MKLFDKISSSGMFKDKRFEHFTLVEFLSSKVLKEYTTKGEAEFTVSFYSGITKVEVAKYEDNLTRFMVFSHLDKNKEYELGRLVIDEEYLNDNINYLLPTYKEKYL